MLTLFQMKISIYVCIEMTKWAKLIFPTHFLSLVSLSMTKCSALAFKKKKTVFEHIEKVELRKCQCIQI